VENLSSPGKFSGISFSIRSGEVVGLAGLIGAGRSEIALSIFGMDPQATGKIFIRNEQVSIDSPRQAMNLGIGLIPEDRKRQGLVLSMSVRHNISLPSLAHISRAGFIDGGREQDMVDEYFNRFAIQAPGPDAETINLSGGNQQKIVLAKWLARNCHIIIFDEPTRGVDVGAKAEIHSLIDELACKGNAILLISSEMPEILNLSTRIIVLYQGRITGELGRAETTQEKVMHLMAGLNPNRMQVH
jgi:ABC-type sugar transport system ATPase subunit